VNAKLIVHISYLPGIQVQLDLKSDGKSNGKRTPASKSRASGSAQKGAQGAAVRGGKRKR